MKAAEVAELSGFPARRTESARANKLRGLGICNCIEVAGGPFLRPGKDNSIVSASMPTPISCCGRRCRLDRGWRRAFRNWSRSVSVFRLNRWLTSRGIRTGWGSGGVAADRARCRSARPRSRSRWIG